MKPPDDDPLDEGDDLKSLLNDNGTPAAAHDLTLTMQNQGDKVMLDFGQKLRAITLTPEQARQLGAGLINHAREHE